MVLRGAVPQEIILKFIHSENDLQSFISSVTPHQWTLSFARHEAGFIPYRFQTDYFRMSLFYDSANFPNERYDDDWLQAILSEAKPTLKKWENNLRPFSWRQDICNGIQMGVHCDPMRLTKK